MAKILIVGNPQSPLVRERGLVGQSAGHEIFWFSRTKAKIPGVKSFGLPERIARSILLSQILQPFYFRRAVAVIQPDLIHVHYAFKGFLNFTIARFHPLLVTAMGSDISPTGAYQGLFAPITRYLLERADCITVKSSQMREMMQKIGGYADKTELITWGVDLNLFKSTRTTKKLKNRFQIPPEALVFFDPRAARPLYNKLSLLEAFASYTKKSVQASVLLMSEFNAQDAYLRQLKEFVSFLKLGKKVRFIPPQTKEGMADLYALADIVVSIPRSDGFPQTIYEAWASGRYLILSDLAQYREEFEDGATGKLVKVSKADELAEAFLWIAQHPEIRQAAREAGPLRAQAVGDKAEQTKKVNQLYARLLSMTHD